MKALTQQDVERFWSKVDIRGESECWEWKASIGSHGYGQLSVNDRPEVAHRLSYLLAHGAITDGLYVCHTCDNKRCVNPSHLFEGTAHDNNQDAQRKGRFFVERITYPGTENSQAKLSEDDVKTIRSEFHAGVNQYDPSNAMELANRYGVDVSTIYNVVKRKKWKHI